MDLMVATLHGFSDLYRLTGIIRIMGKRLSKRGSGSKCLVGNPPRKVKYRLKIKKKSSDIRVNFYQLSQETYFYPGFLTKNILKIETFRYQNRCLLNIS